MSKKHNLYTGRSGQLVVMAEFLHRGYNVAIPEIDVGDDIFVVRDADGDLSRIQVKSATGKGKICVAGRYRISIAQLRTARQPELHYVFALRHDELWREFVVLRRDQLEALQDDGLGSEAQGHIVLQLSFTAADVQCNGVSLQEFRNNWSSWPRIHH